MTKQIRKFGKTDIIRICLLVSLVSVTVAAGCNIWLASQGRYHSPWEMKSRAPL